MKDKLKLYLVTDRALTLGRTLEEIIIEAINGGVTMVQLREKDTPTGEFIDIARRLMSILKPLGVPLIINDRVDVALAVDADGVHIGQSDMKYEDARRILGKNKIIGLSVENIHDIEIANTLDVDYIGISPVYGTPTKTDTAKPFGLDGLKDAIKLSKHPTVAIGGMNKDTAAEVIKTGCDGIAVVSAICSAESPTKSATELKQIIEANSQKSWTESVWKLSEKIYSEILKQDFIKELALGTLSVERFANYIAQDEIYLKNYYHYMLKLADMMDTPEKKEQFTNFAKDGMEGEKLMHKLLIDKYGINTEVKASEVTKKYNLHIQSGIDSGNCLIALAAILPCMWIYNQVGLHILKIAELDNNPYKEWIEEYGNKAFSDGTKWVLNLIDNMTNDVDAKTRQIMNDFYLKSALYEYAFWDYGYSGESKSYGYMYSLAEWI